MQSVAAGVVMVPGIVALLLFLVFTYLYEQSRAAYFRAWQFGWAAYCLHYALDAWMLYRAPSAPAFFLSSLCLVLMALCILASTQLIRGAKFHLRWYHYVALAGGTALAWWNLREHTVDGIFQLSSYPQSHHQVEIALAAVLLFSSFEFYRYSYQRSSLGFRMLALSVALWGVLMGFGQLRTPYVEVFGSLGHLLGPVPQMLLGVAMVIVLFENERRAVQENALAFSTLGVDASKLLSPEDLKPAMEQIVERIVGTFPTRRAVLYIAERWRAVLPSVERGYSADLVHKLESDKAGEYLCELTYRSGGFVIFRNVREMAEPLPAFPGSHFERFREVLIQENIGHFTAVSLQTREHNFGVILFPHAERRLFGSSHIRLLIGLALQIGLTLENYVVMHDAQRRTKEYELLTQIGQALSSRLDQDEVLRTIQTELGQLFDTSNFYIAFMDGQEVRFELEVDGNKVLPKRSRAAANGLTEYIVRTGQPLLIRSDLERSRERLGVTYLPPKPARCFCGAPIFQGGKPTGVMAAMSTEREFVFEQRDLEVLQTAAGQVSVAVENARLFREEQQRSRQLAFLNNVSRTAISSQDAEEMLMEIVGEIQKNFRFDHIGIGILDYVTKEIEIKAEAGTTTQAKGKRIPLGVGILGRVARTQEKALVQNAGEGHLLGVLQESRAVLCIPVSYGETLLGVLNVESRRENAFTPQDVLIMSTLADLLATALHNTFIFQKLQQQSITDGLTGIKTRRFFYEALTSEWKRASRSGRPFSVVLIDLDKFKEVNDTMGHLEGDLVLARVGRLLEQKCRQSNVVARYGGDEFIILMPETGMEQAQILSERLRLWIATDPMLNEHRISGSFGVASFPVHGFTVEDLIRVADAGMYVSKHAGGNRVSTAESFGEGEDAAVKRQLMAAYIEGFLQREHTGPEHVNELVGTLRKLCGSNEQCNVSVLKEAIEALSRAAESREVHATGHGESVARYCEIIGRGLSLPPEELENLAFAARVHDVGKLFLPERILNKPGPLTDDEFYLVKMHPQVGGEILETIPDGEKLQKAVEYHHEAFDGTGYPTGLRGEQIPLHARIIGLADAFANMTAERPFAAAKSSEQALSELEKFSGTRFDGMLVRILFRQLKKEKAATS
jgi:diguanylate cyclase (GGDEF)-like protein